MSFYRSMQGLVFVMLGFAILGAWMLTLAGGSVLLPYRISDLGLSNDISNFAFLISAGWLAQAVTTVAFGFFTDAERRARGSRSVLLWVAIAAMPLSVWLLDSATDWLWLAIGWIAVQGTAGALTAICFAIAGDFINDELIGVMSGVFGAVPGIALLVGVEIADVRWVPANLIFWIPTVVSIVALMPLAIYYSRNNRLMVPAEETVEPLQRVGLWKLVIVVALITAAAPAVQLFPIQYLVSEVGVPWESVPTHVTLLGAVSVGSLVFGSLLSGLVVRKLRGSLEILSAAALVQLISLALMHGASTSGYYLFFFGLVSFGIGLASGSLVATAIWTLGRSNAVGRNLSAISAAQAIPFALLAAYAGLSFDQVGWHETLDSLFVIAALLSLLAIVPLAQGKIVFRDSRVEE